ncbi:fasciclin domain-containing protein [Halomonas sp. PR-M31]|uniref:fasciclin domain-containing protein n=1 Tax=Halomonas sp. PR-M31 TaxID=1471202 RepID=UPI00069DDE65|nr:fasciclin domain-containing protein [Halomonas sp. PR-M31]
MNAYARTATRWFGTGLAGLMLSGAVLAGSGGDSERDIVDTAASVGEFNTLVAAVKAADLVDTLKGEGPFTVFAPTDDAFDALPEGTVEDLLKPENKEQLQKLLTYHVVPEEMMASDLSDGDSVTTVEGGDLSISMEGETVMINDNAKVVQADVEASNGVIHAVDAVLMPE